MKRVAFLALLALPLAACSLVDDESVDSQSSADTVKPVDSETLGYLVVRTPVAPSLMGYKVELDGAQAKLDEPIRIVEGSHTLILKADAAQWGSAALPTFPAQPVTIARAQTTTVLLSALALRYGLPDPSEGDLNGLDPAALDVRVKNPNAGKKSREYCVTEPYQCVETVHTCQANSWGGIASCADTPHVSEPMESQAACQETCKRHYSNSTSAYCTPSKTPCTAPNELTVVSTKSLSGPWAGSGAAVAVWPGTYTVSTPAAAGPTSVTVAPGATQGVDLGGVTTPTRATIAFAPPKSRDLPSAKSDPLAIGIPRPGRNRVTVDPAASRDIRVVGFAPGQKAAFAELGPRHLDFALAEGQTFTLQLGRIDVEDVEVTRENGTKYRAHGTYSVRSVDDNKDLGSYATQSGIDVLPGHYTVVVDYATEEGPRKQTFQLTF